MNERVLKAVLAIVLVSAGVAFTGVFLPAMKENQIRQSIPLLDMGTSLMANDYTPHDPVLIGSDADFKTQGWPGNGTKENPYVMENLNITLDGFGSCISIKNVDCFFVIKNCNFDGNNTAYQYGITLQYTKNGIIENNTISRCQSAIDLETCEDTLIYNNQLSENTYGLWTQRGKNCTIFYNSFCNADNLRGFLEVHTYHHNYYNDYSGYDNNDDGVGDMPHIFRWSYDLYPLMYWPWVELGPAVVPPRNTTHGNITYEVQGPIHIWGENVYGVDFFELKGFLGEGSEENPIIIENLLILGAFGNEASINLERTSKHVIIRNCYLEFGCIMASGAGNVTISNNVVNRTGGTGIWTGGGCTNVTVCNNSIYNTRFGIMSMGDHEIIICNNTVVAYGHSNSEMGLGIRGVGGVICNNTFIGGYYGIRAYSSSINYSIITYNTLANQVQAIELPNSCFNYIANNLVLNASMYGIMLDGPLGCNNSVTLNYVFDCSIGGYDSGENNTFAYNYWSDYVGYDDNNDGFGDMPYNCCGVLDKYPLMYWPWFEPSPRLNSPEDIEYEFNTIGNNITWSVSDYNPHIYELYINGGLDETGFWEETSIVIDIDGLPVGQYNYTLLVNDTSGNIAMDTVIVSVTEITTTTTTTTTTATTTPATVPLDLILLLLASIGGVCGIIALIAVFKRK